MSPLAGGLDRAIGVARAISKPPAVAMAAAIESRLTFMEVLRHEAGVRSLRDDRTLRNILMEVVVKVVASRTERGQPDRNRLARLYRLFPVQLKALEFDGFVAGIRYSNDKRLIGRHR